MEKRLKPIIFVQGDKQFYRQNNFAQTILLKAMSEGITDPNELRKIAGLKSAADVYRTLDKIAIRKEYHEALARNNVSMDYLVNGIKGICDGTHTSDSVRLKAFQTLIRSVGLDKYEKQEDSGKNWEEVIIEAAKKKGLEDKTEAMQPINAEYEVNRPSMPESAKKKIEEEKRLADELYG